NNNGTAADPTDDFADPSLGVFAHDPGITAMPNSPRVSKKYQSKLAGAAGQACADCHGSINARRPIMIPYDENGIYDNTRTISSVESPANNGTKDYCGLVTPNDATDDIDPEAADCANGGLPAGQYFGTPVSTLKDYGAALMSQPRFYDCATTRIYDFVLGKSQGELGLQAAGGTPPSPVDPSILSKYRLVYQGSNWNTRELMRNLFKGDEFLTSQM
ncbi:MAG TPA: hypothetical protein VMV18_01835, partial [bacterium]|nr:hypothetical protein [bacterium]